MLALKLKDTKRASMLMSCTHACNELVICVLYFQPLNQLPLIEADVQVEFIFLHFGDSRFTAKD